MDEQIKPFGVWIEATMRNGEPHAYFERDTDFPRRLVEYGSKAECTYLYPQQSIDALREEVEVLKAEAEDYVEAVKEMGARLVRHREALAAAEAGDESLRADAERYRAMRDEFLWTMSSSPERTDLTLHMSGVSLASIGPDSDEFDAAIDAARKGAE